MHIFEDEISVLEENIEFYFHGLEEIVWSDFLLNPRRLRGSDFLMRWSQGVWSEKRLISAINQTRRFYATPFGPSSTAPSDDVRSHELYFERLENAKLGNMKRPDLLIYDYKDKDEVDRFIKENGGEEELPFIREENLKYLLDYAICAIECENSLWVAEKMPDYGKQLRPMKSLSGKLGLPKNSVLPTVILKEEDRCPLFKWQNRNKIPIHIWHVFFDKAYGISLNRAQELIDDELILPIEQIFQSPGGATSKKSIYKLYYHYAYYLGNSIELPVLEPKVIEDKNGHILPFVCFTGGRLIISSDAIKILENIKNEKY